MACAYCDGPGPYSRDHTWPECFLNRTGRTAAHFSVKARKVHGADYVVNDVCEACNSGPLSEVDTYFCQLYDDYLHDLRDFEATVKFKYDPDLLCRGLLKISYNAARVAGSITEPFQPVRPFILGRVDPPAQLAWFVEVVSPSIIVNMGDPVRRTKVLPQMYRAAISQYLKPGGERLLTRVVAVNSFYFHVLLPKEPMEDAAFEAIAADFGRSIEGLVRLGRAWPVVTLRTSPQDGLRSFMPHLQAYRDQYEQFFFRRRRK